MRRFCVTSLLLCATFALAQSAKLTKNSLATAEAVGERHLPVTRVVLYKNGIGYFEHAGKVVGDQEVTIDFTTAQLNDVLKSLSALDLGNGHISDMRFNSTAPLTERLRRIALPVNQQMSRAEFLNALRGSRIEVTTGATHAAGRLLSVEQRQRTDPRTGGITAISEISLVDALGVLRSFELTPAVSVRLAEPQLNTELRRYMDLLSSTRLRDTRSMTLHDVGSGERQLFVSYISEVPVWKSTYRILLDDKQKPLLQGWAIVDNTIGTDWQNVQLSLVAGAPQSFVQKISEPYYVRRPEVDIPAEYSSEPQTHEAAMQFDRLSEFAELQPGVLGAGSGGGIAAGAMGDLHGVVTDPNGAVLPGAHVTIRNEITGTSQTTITNASGQYSFSNIPAGNSFLTVEAAGFHQYRLSNIYVGAGRMNEISARLTVASSTETVEVRAEAPNVSTENAEVTSVRRREQIEADARPVGDMFSYDVKQRITINKDQSALVPILQQPIEVEKVTLWNPETKRPLRALWLKNTTGLTLDGGTFNVHEDGNFAGEGVLELLHPAEKRLVSYATDRAVEVVTDGDPEAIHVGKVVIAKGTMKITRQSLQTTLYWIRNADSKPREFILEHPVREDWELTDSPKPFETTASYHRFRITVAAGATEKLVVKETHPEEQSYELTDLDSDEMLKLFSSHTVDGNAEAALRRVLAEKEKISTLEGELTKREDELKRITADQGRLRENMKALKGSAEERALLQRYTKQLNDQEDRLATLNAEIDGLNTKKDAEEEQLEKMLNEISLEQND